MPNTRSLCFNPVFMIWARCDRKGISRLDKQGISWKQQVNPKSLNWGTLC
ncbi:hypothetical protein JCM19236_6411 [Vibrio sp. JCM 19236]|nr:hypothetical protein JCM19236_6411 [Vibrio sp. JCM 19236]